MLAEFVDHGAPEFFVTKIELEIIPNSDMIRLYAANSRQGELPLQYSVLIPRHLLLGMGHQIMEFCTTHPALLNFQPIVLAS